MPVHNRTTPQSLTRSFKNVSGGTLCHLPKFRPFLQPPQQCLVRDTKSDGGAADAATFGLQCLLDQAVFLKINRIEPPLGGQWGK